MLQDLDIISAEERLSQWQQANNESRRDIICERASIGNRNLMMYLKMWKFSSFKKNKFVSICFLLFANDFAVPYQKFSSQELHSQFAD